MKQIIDFYIGLCKRENNTSFVVKADLFVREHGIRISAIFCARIFDKKIHMEK